MKKNINDDYISYIQKKQVGKKFRLFLCGVTKGKMIDKIRITKKREEKFHGNQRKRRK